MNRLGHKALPSPDSGRGTFCGKARWEGADLHIDHDAFSDGAVRGLIDDWLVPAIVERILRDTTGASHDER